MSPIDEAALDHRLGGAGSHHGGVGPAAEEQLEGLDDEGLAGAGLAGERRHAGADHEVEVRDDTEVPHSQLDKHRLRSAVGQAETVPQRRVEVALRRS